jgi:hypothetical protein
MKPRVVLEVGDVPLRREVRARDAAPAAFLDEALGLGETWSA